MRTCTEICMAYFSLPQSSFSRDFAELIMLANRACAQTQVSLKAWKRVKSQGSGTDNDCRSGLRHGDSMLHFIEFDSTFLVKVSAEVLTLLPLGRESAEKAVPGPCNFNRKNVSSRIGVASSLAP